MASTRPSEIRVLDRFGACLVCRKRKLRCDGTKPECNRCRTSGCTCQYQDPAHRSRTRVLQDRIKDIEGRIQEIELRRGQSSVCSRVPSAPDRHEPIISTEVLPLQSAPRSAPILSTWGSTMYRAPDPFSSLNQTVPCFGPNSLLCRGSSNLSLPGEASKKFLNMFMQRSLISGFELHTGRVIRSFQPGSSEAGAPALFYAMLLLGCHFVPEPGLKFWENMFFERTKLEVEANVARAYEKDRSVYNPLHHLQAMIMLGQWFYLKGRLLEGYVYTVRATRYAVALGLHELDSRIYGHYLAVNTGSLGRKVKRWIPQDSMELGEAINLWWACFIRDCCGSTMNGLPTSLSLEEIKTVWPLALSDFEDNHGFALPSDSHSVTSLFDSKYQHIVADVSQDTASCIIAKCTVLTYCAGMLDTERISGSEVTDEWRRRFKECDRGIEYFTKSIRKAYVGCDTQEVATIAVSHTAVDCATIQLHGPIADRELDIDSQCGSQGMLPDDPLRGFSYGRCIEACRSIALVTAYAEDFEANYIQMFFGISLSFAARVFTKEIPRLRHSGCEEQAREMEQQMATIIKGMERMLAIYPVLALLVEQLQLLH
ncbi:unnamed protein product [Rhizoctonia solani]|uniref:Zn(2)-C6 fungal-type domain-containing protein n=1 Tax=Rhizoctonia solani TaxID=456999 RepID=A0A8H2XYK2_9AGAM|nr:unnamed protein product [Rhizoctonia solani]